MHAFTELIYLHVNNSINVYFYLIFNLFLKNIHLN